MCVCDVCQTHHSIFPQLPGDVCSLQEKFEFWDSYVIPWCDVVLYTLLPSVVIISCNVLIVYKLTRSRKLEAVQVSSVHPLLVGPVSQNHIPPR